MFVTSVIMFVIVNALGRSEATSGASLEDGVDDGSLAQSATANLVVLIDTFRIEQVIRNLGATQRRLCVYAHHPNCPSLLMCGGGRGVCMYPALRHTLP
jgi:hypothetical protein